MPSNNELKATAIELAGQLGRTETDINLDQNNAGLLELVKSLRIEVNALPPAAPAAPAAPGTDTPPETPAEPAKAETPGDPNAGAEDAADAKKAATAEKAKPKKKPPFTVAKGKSITTKRGILADGEEIKAEDLGGGQESINDFVNSGMIDKN